MAQVPKISPRKKRPTRVSVREQRRKLGSRPKPGMGVSKGRPRKDGRIIVAPGIPAGLARAARVQQIRRVPLTPRRFTGILNVMSLPKKKRFQ